MLNVLVTGASGFIGSAVCRALAAQGHAVAAGYAAHPERLPTGLANLAPVQLDLADAAATTEVVHACKADVVVHLGAMSELAACEASPELARAINFGSTHALVSACKATGAKLIFASTDQVFDGERGAYIESECPSPCHVYGKTKWDAELLLATIPDLSIALRLSLVYGTSITGTRSASEQIVHALTNGESPRLFTNEFRTPILVDDVAAVICELAERMAAGDAILPPQPIRIMHLGGPTRLSRHAFGVAVAEAFGLDALQLCAVRQEDVNMSVKRPRDVSLDSSLAQRTLVTPIRSVRDGLKAHAAAMKATRATPP